MIYVEMMEEKKPEGQTRGKDYAVCNGNPNKFTAAPRKEYSKDDVGANYQTGLTGRQPL